MFKLYEHTSVVIATNLDFAEWGSVFGGAKMSMGAAGPAHATLHIVETGVESYRVTQATVATRGRIKARKQERRCKGDAAG